MILISWTYEPNLFEKIIIFTITSGPFYNEQFRKKIGYFYKKHPLNLFFIK
jgi:hypothetical protein